MHERVVSGGGAEFYGRFDTNISILKLCDVSFVKAARAFLLSTAVNVDMLPDTYPLRPSTFNHLLH